MHSSYMVSMLQLAKCCIVIINRIRGHLALILICIGSLVNLLKITKLTVCRYRAIYTVSMGFFPYSIEFRQ